MAMNIKEVLIAIFLCGFVLVIGCKKETTSTSVPLPKKKIAKKKIKSKKKEEIKDLLPKKLSLYTYDPTNKPDPFKPYIPPKKQKVAVNTEMDRLLKKEEAFFRQFKYVGMIKGGKTVKAIIEGPDGKGYIVFVGATIAQTNGVIKAITEDHVIIKTPNQEIILKQQTSLKSKS